MTRCSSCRSVKIFATPALSGGSSSPFPGSHGTPSQDRGRRACYLLPGSAVQPAGSPGVTFLGVYSGGSCCPWQLLGICWHWAGTAGSEVLVDLCALLPPGTPVFTSSPAGCYQAAAGAAAAATAAAAQTVAFAFARACSASRAGECRVSLFDWCSRAGGCVPGLARVVSQCASWRDCGR